MDKDTTIRKLKLYLRITTSIILLGILIFSVAQIRDGRAEYSFGLMGGVFWAYIFLSIVEDIRKIGEPKK